MPFVRTFFLLILLICAPIGSPAFGQEDAAEVVVDIAEAEVAELEAVGEAPLKADDAPPAINDTIPVDLIPAASGIAFGGMDPEQLDQANMMIVRNGQLIWTKGVITNGEDGTYTIETKSANDSTAGMKGWLANPTNRLWLLGSCKWLALSAALGWPFVAFVLRGTLYADDKYDPTRGSHFYKFVGWVTNVAVLAILGGLFLVTIHRPALWMGAPNIELSHIKILVWVLMGGVALSLLGSILAWGKGYWRIPGRIHYTLATIGALVFLYFLVKGGIVPNELAPFLG